MIDVTSVLIGLLVGGMIGFLIASIFGVKRIEEISAERDVAQQKLKSLTDRDERGRFVRK